MSNRYLPGLNHSWHAENDRADGYQADFALAGAASQAGSPPPIVTTTLTTELVAGGYDGLILSQFQGFNPPVTGGLTIALGGSAYAVPALVPSAVALQHVLAGTPVINPTSLIDLNFTTPAQGLSGPIATDVAIAANTDGLSGILGPLSAALVGTTLGTELAPIIKISQALLQNLDKNGGLPKGGSTNALPFFALGAGVTLAQSLTVLGHTTNTSQSGSLKVNQATGPQAVTTANDLSRLFGNAGTLVADVQSGNLLGAVPAGVATLASGATVGADLVPLLADAARQHNPMLPAIANPAMSLDLNTGTSQSFALGIVDPVMLTETLGVKITADKFGAYALGKLLGQVVPQVIQDLSGGGTHTPFDVLSQLAQGVSTLSQDAASGFAGQGGAGAVPSLVARPDISIQVTLGVTETQNQLLGSVTNGQTITTNFETNAQGLYDLGTTSQPAITALLVAILETPGGREALQIGGAVLTQLDTLLGYPPPGSGSAPAHAPTGVAAANLSAMYEPMFDFSPAHWHM